MWSYDPFLDYRIVNCVCLSTLGFKWQWFSYLSTKTPKHSTHMVNYQNCCHVDHEPFIHIQFWLRQSLKTIWLWLTAEKNKFKNKLFQCLCSLKTAVTTTLLTGISTPALLTRMSKPPYLSDKCVFSLWILCAQDISNWWLSTVWSSFFFSCIHAACPCLISLAMEKECGTKSSFILISL